MDMHVFRNVRVAFRGVQVVTVCLHGQNTEGSWRKADVHPAELLPSSTGGVFTGTNLLPLRVQVRSWGVKPPPVGVILPPGHLPACDGGVNTHFPHICKKPPSHCIINVDDTYSRRERRAC